MALIRMGVMVGQASGSLGSTVFSFNRYGAYTRLRAKPVTSTSPYAELQKSILGLSSQVWGNLSEDDRNAWVTWAQTNPITNRIGDKQILDGHTACTRINANLLTIGEATVDVPPVASAPEGLLTLSMTADIGAGDFELVFTPTPIGATNKLQVWAAVVNNSGVRYVKNRFKLVTVSAANAPSPLDIEADVVARFGTLQVGQTVHIRANIISTVSGLISSPYPTMAVVTST